MNAVRVLYLLTVLVCISAEYACKDELGESVDWFYAYKLPRLHEKDDTQGVEFMYMKPDVTQWTRSPKNIDDKDSIIGRTMLQAFTQNSNQNRLVAAYNDEPPGAKADGLNGHTKGVLVADDQTGFWVVHSVPLYPLISDDIDNYTYPASAHMYGQSFLCISLPSSEIDKVGLQLLYNEPHVYEFDISDNLRSKYPNVVDAAAKKKITKSPFFNLATIHSVAGVQFQSFAKSRHFDKDLYEDWVAPVLHTDLYVETWIHGGGVLPSNCTQTTKVWNIAEIEISAIDLEFKTLKDHSKWAVSSSNVLDWICVGDINRGEHQKVRGGGTVCQQSSPISRSYRALIKAFDPCSKS